jgi:hypothetical protein
MNLWIVLINAFNMGNIAIFHFIIFFIANFRANDTILQYAFFMEGLVIDVDECLKNVKRKDLLSF